MTKGKSKRSKAKPGKEPVKAKAPKATEAPAVKPMVDDVPQKPSDALAAIVGPGHFSLRQANHLVWAYVQRNGFQDREQPHMIRIKEVRGKAELLKAIVGGERISMFELTDKLRKHLG